MSADLLLSNLTNPTLLYFLLGVLATIIKSDLEIPATTSKFISLYLLFAIGFKGGQELSHSGLNMEIVSTLLLSMVFASVVPFYTFFILKRKLSVANAAAIAAAYGSVSAVTFITATSFLESINEEYSGHMVAAMALMESPAIMIGVIMMRKFGNSNNAGHSMKKIVHDSLTNGSVLMIVGSLIIGIIADTKQAEGIKPFTNDIFKGFLAIFLLDMGMLASKRFGAFRSYGLFVSLFALIIPLFNGVLSVFATSLFDMHDGNRLLFAILASSASYIAVPAAMRQIAPDADPGLYVPMALGITFPVNITLGLMLYWSLIQAF